MDLLCPLCGLPLELNERTWRCASGHSYDVAKQGYVNLLPVQQKRSLHPGDTNDQLHARRRFLSAGFYAPIAAAVCELLAGADTLLDVGCGEGWYLRQFGAAHPEAERWGLDISRDAVRLAKSLGLRAIAVNGSGGRGQVRPLSGGLGGPSALPGGQL